jgi:hypothetical protein
MKRSHPISPELAARLADGVKARSFPTHIPPEVDEDVDTIHGKLKGAMNTDKEAE